MSLKYGKREIAKVVAALEAGHETAEEAAAAAIAAAEEIFEARAKFVVVGQLSGTKERQHVPADDPEAVKVSLGWYSTEGDAFSAASSMWTSTQSGDTFRTWVLPVHHGSPADMHKKRKEAYAATAQTIKDKAKGEFAKAVKKYQEDRWNESMSAHRHLELVK